MTMNPFVVPCRLRRAWLVLLALAVLSSGCDELPQSPLRVGVNPWVGYDPLVLARERKLLDPADLRVVDLESSSESARQLRNGLLEAAGLTLAEAIELSGSGVDLRVIALLSLSRGADAVVARPALRTPAALKGARIGMENSALADVMLRRLIEAGGLRREDLKILSISVVEHESALSQGRVDAVITFEPVLSRLRGTGHRIVLDSSEMPGEVVDVLVIRADALRTRPAQAKALLAAFERGRLALIARPQDAARALAPGTDLDEAQYLDALGRVRIFSLEDSVRMLGEVPDVPVLALQQLADDLLASGRLTRQPDWNVLFDRRVAADVRDPERTGP